MTAGELFLLVSMMVVMTVSSLGIAHQFEATRDLIEARCLVIEETH